jgi:thiol:disulfide interchange protein DsbA
LRNSAAGERVEGKLPADVQFTPVAAPFGYWSHARRSPHRGHGLLGKTHDAMFRAIHVERSLPVQLPTPEQIAGFYAKYGANPAVHQHHVELRGRRQACAEQFLTRSGVTRPRRSWSTASTA